MFAYCLFAGARDRFFFLSLFLQFLHPVETTVTSVADYFSKQWTGRDLEGKYNDKPMKAILLHVTKGRNHSNCIRWGGQWGSRLNSCWIVFFYSDVTCGPQKGAAFSSCPCSPWSVSLQTHLMAISFSARWFKGGGMFLSLFPPLLWSTLLPPLSTSFMLGRVLLSPFVVLVQVDDFQ